MPRKSNPSPNVLAKRLKQARERIGLPQDKLGVMIGIDEGCSSARISRYESGIHQPPLQTVSLLAKKLDVPMAFLFCENDTVAEIILRISKLDERELQTCLAVLDGQIENNGVLTK